MAVLSVDLAHKAYSNIGAVIIRSANGRISCQATPIDLTGEPTATALSRKLDAICQTEGIKSILLDGPQGWRGSENGLQHSRVCERELNTPGKTGLPEHTKPASYLAFISFSIATFDALSDLGWQRLLNKEAVQSGRVLLESFPFSAWRCLGLKALPSKSKARPADIEVGLRSIQALMALTVDKTPNHDELQAIVSGLAGVAYEEGNLAACHFAGVAPSREDGSWREGWIINRKRP